MPSVRQGPRKGNPTGSVEEGYRIPIGDLAAATGMPAETIRIWERRYGKPKPWRLPSGHRRYDESHVLWLRRMAEGVALGHSPSYLAHLSATELDALIDPLSPELRDDPELARLLSLVASYRGAELRNLLLLLAERLGAVEFLRRRVIPLLHGTARVIERQPFGIRHCHFLAELLHDVLRVTRRALPEPNGKRTLLLTTLPEDHHDLGLQMAALLCALNRVPTVLFSHDLPESELLLAIRELEPFGLCMSIANVVSPSTLKRRLSALRTAIPERMAFLVGGSSLRTLRNRLQGIEVFASLDEFELRLRTLAL